MLIMLRLKLKKLKTSRFHMLIAKIKVFLETRC